MVKKTEDEWQKILNDEQFVICRKKGTEPPFTGVLLHNKEPGIYTCTCCDTPLFHSSAKYDSGSGWPSFFEPIQQDNIRFTQDNLHNMQRVEVLCAKCDAHLGHIFEDGPPPTGKRFCINSVALQFKPAQK